MEEEIVRILRVEAGQSAETLRELKAAVDTARESVRQLEEDGKSGTAEYQKALVDLKTAQQAYSSEMRVTVKENGAAKSSYNELAAQLSRLMKQWKETSDEAERAKLGQQIGQINTQLKDLDAEIGNYQRNVGDYRNSIMDALVNLRGMGGAAGSAAAGIASLTRGAQAFTATGFGAVLAVIAQALNLVVKGFKSSEENMNALAVAFAPFKAGGQLVTNMLQNLAKALGTVGNWLNNILERTGLMTDRMKENQEIVREEIAITKERRRVTVDNARLEMEVAEARNQAADKANLSTRERIALLESAAAKEKQIADNNLALAEREFALAQRRAELTGNDAAANDELAQKEAALYTARAQYASAMRRITSQLSTETLALRKEIGDTTAVAVEMVKALEISASWLDRMDTGIAARMEAQKQALREAQELGTGMAAQLSEAEALAAEASDAALAHFLKNVEAEREANERRLQNHRDLVAGIQDLTGSLADVYEADIELRVKRGDITEAQAEREFETVKALQYAETWINTIAGAHAALTAPTLQGAGPVGWAMAAAQAGTILASGIAQTLKIASTTFGSRGADSGASVSQGGAVNAPAVIQQVPVTRQVTSAEDEERLRAAQKDVKVQLVWTDVQKFGRTADAQDVETSFGG